MTAIVGFATGQSVYAQALVMTAIEENIVLVAPAAAPACACALVPPRHELGVGVLLGLPCTVIEVLDVAQARTAGALLQQSGEPGRGVAAAQVVLCARQRGWPVVTSDPEPLLTPRHLRGD